MFNPHNPADLAMAQAYEADLFAEAKANPHIGKGMSVEAFLTLDDGRTSPVCEGLVIDFPEWDEAAGMNKFKVLVGSKKYWIYDVCLRRSRGAIRDVFVNEVLK